MFFARPRAKKSVLVAPPKKRKASHAIEEIKFDPDAREEYLTGFHKRKVQRTKRAQEENAKRARQEKIDLRKQVREERKKEIEEHVQSVTAILKEAERAGYIDEAEDISGDGDADGGGGEWGGFEDVPAAAAAADEPLDHEEEYIDEDRYTTVTVESVNVSRDGLIKPEEEKETAEDDDESAKQNTETTSMGQDKSRMAKKKKPQFRYETKMERQHEQRKQSARKRKKAVARTG